MTNYKELVERLRTEQFTLEELSIILPKATAAIEDLIESVHIRDKHLDELNHYIWELEAKQPHWVSVEQPPKKDGKYLVCWKDGGGFCYDTAWWTSVGTWSLSHWTGVTVTHWMSIEPPKEDA